ncbi:MAG: hypothetical protein JRD04_03280 [Deltaproteobacteria bacterium]|nr:hypothetical protein [Deltaproteobacteria bacterium]
MSNDQDLSQEGKEAPAFDLNPGSDPDELNSDEIIELMDVVSEGKDTLDAGAPLLLDAEAPDHDRIKLNENVTAEGLALPSPVLEETDPAVAASATLAESAEMEEAFPDNGLSTLESSDFKFESSSALDAADTESFPVQSQEHLDDVLADLEKSASDFGGPEDILADLKKDALEAEEPQFEESEAFLSAYGEPDDDEKPGSAGIYDIPGISEEKMRELLTEIIQETVDKAVRETVSEVAEKIIQEAIDSLKQSIASSDTVSASDT